MGREVRESHFAGTDERGDAGGQDLVDAPPVEIDQRAEIAIARLDRQQLDQLDPGREHVLDGDAGVVGRAERDVGDGGGRERLDAVDGLPLDRDALVLKPLFSFAGGGIGVALGDIEQVPATVSAIKVDGRRAHALARDGEEFELAARAVTVSSMPISVAEMMSAPFTSRDAKLFDSQVNMFRRFLKGSIRKNAKR